jgi:hypothetical protein
MFFPLELHLLFYPGNSSPSGRPVLLIGPYLFLSSGNLKYMVELIIVG